MNIATKIPGFDLASELFKDIVVKNVTVPTDTVWGESWQSFLQHRELKIKNFSKIHSNRGRFGFENWGAQARELIQAELEEISHLSLAINGYPFRLGNLSFLADSKKQDGYLWPVFVPLSLDSPNFTLKVYSYGEGVEVQPYSLHPDLMVHYQKAIQNLKDIRKRAGGDSTSIAFENMASPPNWASEAIHQAQQSRLFSHMYILVDHGDIPWEVYSGKNPIDIKEMSRRELAAQEAEARRKEEIKRLREADPMVIGCNSYTRQIDPYGSFTVNSWSVIALYDPSRHERYVYEQFALPPRKF